MNRLVKRLLTSGVVGALAVLVTAGTAHAGVGMNHNETVKRMGA